MSDKSTNSKRYLYGRSRNGYTHRCEIIRETACYYVIQYGYKVNKKTMSTGKGFETYRYYLETPELKAAYEKQIDDAIAKENYLKKLDELKHVKNPDTIKKVMEIVI
jgi:hypothetical protein